MYSIIVHTILAGGGEDIDEAILDQEDKEQEEQDQDEPTNREDKGEPEKEKKNWID